MGRLDNLKIASCCFFIPLQAAVKIIAVLWQIGGLLALYIDVDPYPIDAFSDSYHLPMREKLPMIAPEFFNYLVDVINFAVGTVLLVGGFKKLPRLLEFFCIVVLAMVTLELIAHIEREIVKKLFHFDYLVGILVDLYCILVVKSAYHEMKEGLVKQSDPEGQGGQEGQDGQVINVFNDNNQMNQLKPLDM